MAHLIKDNYMTIKRQDYLLINSLGKSGGGRWWVFLIISICDVNSKVNQDFDLI